MAAAMTWIRECPERGCTGSLRTSHHALTMRCACDTCGREFLVAYVGVTERWEEAPAWFRKLELDAIQEAEEWKRRFAEAKKRLEEKRERERKVAEERLAEARLREEQKKTKRTRLVEDKRKGEKKKA